MPCSRRLFDEPYENAPPCSHTITGRRAALSAAGVQTFSVRQSSVSGEASGGPEKFTISARGAGPSRACGACPA